MNATKGRDWIPNRGPRKHTGILSVAAGVAAFGGIVVVSALLLIAGGGQPTEVSRSHGDFFNRAARATPPGAQERTILSDGQTGSVAGGGAAVALVPVDSDGAFSIVGNEIILPKPGVTVTLEIQLSGWAPDLLTGYQATIDSAGYTSAKQGTLIPKPCFIEKTRTDYVFFGQPEINACEDSPLDYRYGGVLLFGGVPDPGIPQYGGTLVLNVPPDAHGTFTVGFLPPPETGMVDESGLDIPVTLVDAQITVTTGKCCIHIPPDLKDCIDNVIENDCAALGGAYTPNDVCTGDPFLDCPQADVPCCLPDGNCIDMLEPDCVGAGGSLVESCPADGLCIPPGDDCFPTPCGQTHTSFAKNPIPADFFGPGSLPFDGVINLQGAGTPGGDTIVRRLQAAAPDIDAPPETVEIEIVALSLVSCEPIRVPSDTGVDSFFDVFVDLSPTAAPPGQMEITKTHENGGYFTSSLNVQPRFTFTNVEDPTDVRVLDTSDVGKPPIPLETIGLVPWVHNVIGGVAGVPALCTAVNFIPGMRQDPSTLNLCCVPIGHAGPGHLHVTGQICNPCPEGACCNTASGSCTLVQGAAECNGFYVGDGTDCEDIDGDGIADWLETNDCNDPARNRCRTGTDPNNPDTDGDGLLDGVELKKTKCDPCFPDAVDTDGDGIGDVCGEGHYVKFSQPPKSAAGFCSNDLTRDCTVDNDCWVCPTSGVPCPTGDCSGVFPAEDCNTTGVCLVGGPAGEDYPSDLDWAPAVCSNDATLTCTADEDCWVCVPSGLPCLALPDCAPGDTSCDITGICIASGPNQVAADDFVSDGRPITAVRWWGSNIPKKLHPGVEVAPGVDLWQTSPGSSYQDFSGAPIPADFFDAGSDPFTDIVNFEGVPLNASPSLGATDTIVERLAPAPMPDCPDSTATIPIEIVALSLRSTTPITVTYNGGLNPELWDVRVFLANGPQQQGTMTIQQRCDGGGTFDSVLPVEWKAVFTRQSDAAVRVFDTIAQGVGPTVFTASGTWVYQPDPIFGAIQATPGTQVDTDGDGLFDIVLAIGSSNFFPGFEQKDCFSCKVPPGGQNKPPLTPEQAQWAAHGVNPVNQAQQPLCCIPFESCFPADPAECATAGGFEVGDCAECPMGATDPTIGGVADPGAEGAVSIYNTQPPEPSMDPDLIPALWFDTVGGIAAPDEDRQAAEDIRFAVATWEDMAAFDEARRTAASNNNIAPFPEAPAPEAVEDSGRLQESREESDEQGLGSVAAPPLSTSFQGITDTGWIPPDTMGAVGPNHLVSVVNGGFQVFDRGGGKVTPLITLQAFWSALGTLPGQPASIVFDPKILYDQYSDRWIVTADGNPNNRDGTNNSWVLVGISKTNSPTGAWNLYAIQSNINDLAANVDHTNDWSDYPGLGVDPNNVVITNNMFTVAVNPGFVHADVWVISKASLMAGVAALVQGVDYALFHDPCGTGGFTFQPCHTFGQTAGNAINHLVDQGWLDQATTTRRFIRVKDITGVGAAAVLNCRGGNDWVEVNGYNFSQLDAPQPLCSTPIETNDTRLLNAVCWKGRIWTTHSVGVGVVPWPPSAPSKTEVAWYEIDPSAAGAFPGGVPNQQGRVSDPSLYYYFPSIAVNKDECVALGFSGSDDNTFASAYYTVHDPVVDAPGATQPVSLLKAGVDSYLKTFGSVTDRNRWGDYSATVVDPRDFHTFWTVQEYAEDQADGLAPPQICALDLGQWGTWWGSFQCENSIDGWFISFHEHLQPGDPQAEPLALYYCDVKVVDVNHTKLPDCQDHQVFEYEVNLDRCCLVHANVDSRTGTVPAMKNAFYEEKCLAYHIDIQAVAGVKYHQDKETGVCIEKKTGKGAFDHFWGWHTTINENGIKPAVVTSVKMGPNGEWLYGPWNDVVPKCSFPNMAFELFTDQPPVTQPEACCLPDGSCADLTPAECCNQGGTQKGPGTTCLGDEACCLPDNTCAVMDAVCCVNEGGAPQGAGSVCQPLEACCFTDGTCQDLDPQCCNKKGGTPQGAGTDCTDPNICGQETEACCLPDNTCVDLAPADCTAQGGSPQGAGSNCLPLEACCLPDNTCRDLDPQCCIKKGGQPQGPGSVCQQPVACCLPDNTCQMLDPLCCEKKGGVPNFDGTCGGIEACCRVDSVLGNICEEIDALCCLKKGGQPQGPGSVCQQPEACCLPDNTCQMLDPFCCEKKGGSPQGLGSACQPVQACCLPDNTCRDLDPQCCIKKGGQPQGPGSVCQPLEACCLPDNTCQMLDPLCCEKKGGVANGPGSVCLGTGACCFPDKTCEQIDGLCCQKKGGSPEPPGTTCATTDPPKAPTLASHAAQAKNRYLSFVPNNPGRLTALRVTLTASTTFPGAVGSQWWVTPMGPAPMEDCENAGQGPSMPPGVCGPASGIPKRTFWDAELDCTQVCMDWTVDPSSGAAMDVIHIGDEDIAPGSTYEIVAFDCDCGIPSPPLSINTAAWGDIVLSVAPCPDGPPNGVIDISDVVSMIDKFTNAFCAPLKARADLRGPSSAPDRVVDVLDITEVVNAFSAAPYPFPGPVGCP